MPVALRASRTRRTQRRPRQCSAFPAVPSRAPSRWETLGFGLLILLDMLLGLEEYFDGIFLDVLLLSRLYNFEAYVAAQVSQPSRRGNR